MAVVEALQPVSQRTISAHLGLDASDMVGVTNAVKHFKWEPRGKRRLHKRPGAAEISACRPWLDQEIELVRPRVVVCLGATAAQALLGRTFRVTKQRGELFPQPAGHVITATVHPSSILRAPDLAARDAEMAAFTADLRLAARHVGPCPPQPRRPGALVLRRGRSA